MNMIKIFLYITLILASLTAIAVDSSPTNPVPFQTTKIQITPALQLQMGVDSLLAYMHKDPRPTPQAITRFLNEKISPFFDFKHMAKSAAGHYYARFSAKQQHGMAKEMQHLFLTRLAQKLVGFESQEVRYLPSHLSKNGKEAVTGLVISNFGNYPSRIDFRLRRTGNGWSIIDVAANGQSAIIYYRQQLMRKLMGYQRRW